MRAEPTPRRVELGEEALRRWQLPAPGDDKEGRGRTLVVGGTSDTPGAVLLAGEAVLRAGAGKLQIATAAPVAAPLAVAVPEARVVPLPVDGDGNLDPSAADRILELADAADAVLAGSGFSDPDASTALLEAVIPRITVPLVIDALASAHVTAAPDGLHHLAGRAVLSLNPNEIAHCLGVEEDDVTGDPTASARKLAEATRAVVLLGGQDKHIASPDGRTWVATVGGPGLGVSGSGDVQAGIVAGLLARGAAPEQAACWGAYLHGAAGAQLAREQGTVGFLAREIAPCVPRLIAGLSRRPPSGSR